MGRIICCKQGEGREGSAADSRQAAASSGEAGASSVKTQGLSSPVLAVSSRPVHQLGGCFDGHCDFLPVCTEHQYGLWEGDRGDCLHLHRAPAQVGHRQHSGLDVESRLHHSLQEYPFPRPADSVSRAHALNLALGAQATARTYALLAEDSWLCASGQLVTGARWL